MTFHKKLLLTVFLLHIIGIVGLYYFWDPVYLLVFFLGHTLFIGVGQECGLHRLFSHRSFDTHPWIEKLLIVLSIFSVTGNSIGWCATHRTHHRNADKANDSHPASEWFKTWFWIERTSYATINPTMFKDLLRNPWHRITRDYYFVIYWTTLIILTALLGFKFVLYFFVLVGAVGMHSSGLVNVVCHKWGYRNFDTNDTSTNNFWVNLWSKGGGLHNNHHANPASHTNKVKPNEWDFWGWVIKNVLATKVR